MTISDFHIIYCRVHVTKELTFLILRFFESPDLEFTDLKLRFQAEFNGFPFQFMEKIANESDFNSDYDYDCSSESIFLKKVPTSKKQLI